MFSSPSSLLTVPFLLTETMGETSAHYYYLYHLIALTPLKSPFPPTSEAVLPALLSGAMTKFPGTLARRETSFHGGPWESRRQCPGNEGSPGNTAKQPEAAKFSLPPSFQAGQVAVRKPAKSQRWKRAQVKASLQNGCQVVSPPRKQFATIRMKLKICYEPQMLPVNTQAHPTGNPAKHHSLVLKALIMGGGIQHKIRNLDSMI